MKDLKNKQILYGAILEKKAGIHTTVRDLHYLVNGKVAKWE